ncbi:MAG TPA: hypothetical protein VF981_05785 [Gemmatimonadaceae bacterium]
MIRHLVLVSTLIVAGSVPALAQVHPPGHTRPSHPAHGPGHVPPDSATHAALHTLLHGDWTGTLTHDGMSGAVHLTVAHDSLRNVTVALRADRPFRLGAAHNLRLVGDTIQWMQTVSTRTCMVKASLSAATPLASSNLRGRMTCGDANIPFTMHRNAG